MVYAERFRGEGSRIHHEAGGNLPESKGGSLGDAFVYYIILLVINAVLSAIVLAAGLSAMSIYQSIPGFNGAFPLVMFFMVLVGGIIGIFVGGAWLHIFVWALGGKKGYVQTVKSVMYGSTPSLLLGWIPIIGFIGAIWTIILDIFGIKESSRRCRLGGLLQRS